MSTEFYNSQWQMPNEANQSKSANYSLNFTFADASYVDFGNNIPTLGYVNPTDTFSISTWVNTAWGSQYVFGNRDSTSGFAFTTYPVAGGADHNGLLLRVGSTDIVATLDRNDLIYNSWVHFVWVYDGSGTNNSDKIKAYQNGTPLSLTFPFGNFPSTISSNLNFYAGAYTWTGVLVGQYEGGLNELSIFDYALSQSQVTTLWGGGTEASNPMSLYPTPKAYYPLSESVWDGSDYITANNAVEDYVFDFASSDSIDTNFTLPNYNSYSISVWYKKDRGTVGALPAGDHYLWGNATSGDANKPRTSVRFNDTNELRIITGDGTVYFQSPDLNVSTLLLDGKWHHILTTTVSGEIKLYIDGGLQATHTNSNIVTGIVAETSYRIGQSGYNAGYLTESLLSNFQLFNTALSGPEVETLYNNGSPTQTLANIPQSSNLKAWYKLDATEIYNGTTTEWEVNNSSNPSIYNNFINFNNKWMKVYPIGSGNNGEGGLILPDTYTISLWAKMNSDTAGFFEGTLHTGGFHPGWGNPFRYNAIVNGKWRLYNAGSVIYVTSDITDGKWHHILLTYSSSTTTLTVYTDNIQTFTSSSRNYGTENNIGRIGSGSDGNSNFTGNISNISIWDGVVTTSQRGELYNNGAPKDLINNSNYSNLKHWYIFNSQETGIRTLIDQKGSNNLLAYSQHTPTFGFINTLAGESTGMSQSNLVQSDLQTVAPYSKYALDFDGNDYIDCGNSADFSFGNGTTDSPFSTSFWFKLNSNSATIPFLSKMTVGKEWTISVFGGNGIRIFLKNLGTNNQQSIDSTTTFSTGVWYHAITTYDGRGGANAADGLSIYINGSLDAPTNVIKQTYTAMSSSSSDVTIGKYGGTYINGVMSNVAIWDTALSTSEVREIYNEGLPSNLNTFSGTAPIAWWKLGEGVSYDSTYLHVRDYIGSNHGVSSLGMDQSGIVNGVGTSNNGTGNGFSAPSSTITNIFSGPYSDKNAVSVNMQSAKTNSGIDTSTPQAT
jgi:hypothetical protein